MAAASMPFDSSPGEVGGIFAGVIALLYAIGRGVKWAFGWADRRLDKRTTELEAWHGRLAKREAEFEAAVNARLTVLERENRALRLSFQHVSAALHQVDPDNPALVMAARILAQTIPLDPDLPSDMTDKLDKLP